ncbi:MAG: hypothetical protein ACYTHM_24450 [Planctomycetota bacterium]|jgi:membrane-bound metal-dependent hydrolase YbcI (DUF457 family)
MKGLTHFISGVGAASFVKAAVTGAAEDTSFALVLAGVGGILPDTLDFKFAQFVEPRDFEIDPDPRDPDPEAIAAVAVKAVEMAWEESREIRAQFHTAQIAGDLFRQYFLRFDPEAQTLTVRIGPAVTMSQVPQELGDGVEGRCATVRLPYPIRYAYEEESAVDIFNGPSFGFRKTRDGEAVELAFIPWHRRWSHSLTMGTLFAALVALALGPIVGLCAGIGWFTHVLQDQLGHMGSNLFFPFTRDRSTGLQVMRSGDALPNFAFVWLSVVLIFWNLNRFHETPVLNPAFFSGFLPYFGISFLLPLAGLWILGRFLTSAERRREEALIGAGAAPDAEAKMEMDESFSG